MKDYLSKIKAGREESSRKKEDDEKLEAFTSLATEIRTLLGSLEKTGAKKLDKSLVDAISKLDTIAKSMKEVRVTSDSDIKNALVIMARAIQGIEIKPVVNVPQTKVEVNEKEVDLKPLLEAIKKLKTKAPVVNVDLEALKKDVQSVTDAINGLRFPTANYILPYKDPTTGKATQVLLDSNGNVPVAGDITVDTTGLATEAEQEAQTALLTTVDTDTGNIASNTGTIAGAVSGSEMQVDIVSGSQTDALTDTQLRATPVPVSGTFYQATQPVSGTVTANLSATDNTVLDNIDTNTSRLSISGIGHGVKTVTTAGTDEALAGSTACKRITIQAQTDNTSAIAVGGTGVDATIATGTGVLLYPGDVFELEIDNLADVYIDSLVNGEGVRYTYFN